MSNLEVKIYPDPCLRIRTRAIEEFGPDLKNILKNMADLMYFSQGVGLAAPQVGLGMRLMTIDIGGGLINFVNPIIVEMSDKKSNMEEGCLSLPGISVNVARPEKIKVRAQDENGDFFMKSFNGLYAKAIQHEVDHLNGKLIIDYLGPVRALLAKKKICSDKANRKEKTCEVVCHAGKKNSK